MALTRTAVPLDPQGTTKRAQMARQATTATGIRVTAAGSVRRRITESLRTLAARGVGGEGERGMSNVQNAPVYKAYRIHTTRLTFGTYISLIVSVGKRHLVTEDSLTDTVLRVPGEFLSKDEALLAAKRYIDATDSGKQA